MKNILAFGDSLTWGYVAGKDARHAFEDRWPNALAAGLKGNASVLAEGMNARTTVFDDPTDSTNLSGAKQDRDPNPARPKGSEDRDSDTASHKRVIEAVASGRADVGVAPRRQFEIKRYRRGGLVELSAYPVTSDAYIARPGLDTNVLQAARQSLASFQTPEDKRLLAQLTEYVVIEGFDPITDDDFEEIRSALSKELVEFERATPSSKP